MRHVPHRQKLPAHPVTGISDAVMMTSRNGHDFDRAFMEGFFRAGRDQKNWGDRVVSPTWGLLQTGDDAISLYFDQRTRFPSKHIVRATLRLDGFASAQAGYEGGELVTRPLRFQGQRLELNYATSAVGSVRVEIQTPDGQPIDGFAASDAKELYGDEIAGIYSWTSGSDVSALAGKPIRLRFLLKDVDLYAYRFVD